MALLPFLCFTFNYVHAAKGPRRIDSKPERVERVDIYIYIYELYVCMNH